jgi:saccharopine dehydrogenase (NAD+, L-lysine-forming)
MLAEAFDDLVLADVDARRLRELTRTTGVGGRTVRGSDAASLRAAVRGAGVVVNCTSYRLGVAALGAAIAERAHYLDLGGLYNTPKQLGLDDRARRAGITAVIGCGATPGLSNVLARRGADRLDAVHEIHISFASHRDVAPSPGLLDTLLDEFRPGVPRFVWREGELHPVAPFEGARKVRFPAPLGMQEVYYVPHSETYTLPRSLAGELREVAVRGTWRPSDMRTLETLARLGLTSDRPVRVDGVRVSPLSMVRSILLADPPTEPDRPWAFFVHVEVVGTLAGAPATIRLRASHPDAWGRAATGRMTAVPAVVGARLIADGHVAEPGVLPPERAFDPSTFVRGVRRLGVRVSTSGPG